MDQLFAVDAADVAATDDDCYTPRWIFDAAGLVFDLDVCAPVDPSGRTCPARRYLTPIEDGLTAPWDGLVWMNPPFSNLRVWVERFSSHGCGLGLFPMSRSESYWTGRLLRAADAMAIISSDFIRPDGGVKRIAYALILAGCGERAAEAVARIAAADKYAGGAYHVRPRHIER
jgi:hypothetical protein